MYFMAHRYAALSSTLSTSARLCVCIARSSTATFYKHRPATVLHGTQAYCM